MGDQDPKRDKGKEKVSADEDAQIIADMVTELYDSSWDCNNPAGASGEGSGAGNPGQDALRFTPVINLPHGHQQPGGSSFRGDHVIQLQTPASGSVPPMGSLQQALPDDNVGKNAAWPFAFPPPPVLNRPEVWCPMFPLRGNPTQNAPPPRSPAPVLSQLQASLTGQQLGGGALGGSSSLQAPASGNMAPQLQPREFSPQAWAWGAKMASRIMAGRPGGSPRESRPERPALRRTGRRRQPAASQLDGTAPRRRRARREQQLAGAGLGEHGAHGFSATRPSSASASAQGSGLPGNPSLPPALPVYQHWRPGHQQPPRAPIPIPIPNTWCEVCCFLHPCRVCGHGFGQAAVPDLPPPPPPPVAAAVEQLPNQPAVDVRPVGQLGDAPGGYAAHLGHPVPPADQPGAGPDRKEDLRCPACDYHPMPAKLQPRWHVCVCHDCRSHDIFCSVCDSGP